MVLNSDSLLPVVRVAEIPLENNSPHWLVEQLWGASSVGVIGGAPKCSKTWLGLDLALSVATGTACLGKYAVPQAGPVLVYLAEDALPIVRQRVEGMARHRGLALEQVEIHVITAPTLRLDRDPHRRQLLETAKRLRPRLLLLDPLVRLHGIDENNAGEVAGLLAYIRALQRQLDLSVILVHHTRKNAAGGMAAGQSLRGSGDLHAFGDSNLYLRRTRERLLLSSEHRAAPASPPVYLELVAANARRPIWRSSRNSTPSSGAAFRSRCSRFWPRASCSRGRNSATRLPSRTNAWARPWNRWSAPAASAARRPVGNASTEGAEGRSPFPI